MTWETVEFRQSSIKPVTVRLRRFVRKGTAVSLPTFSVAMKKAFSQLVGWNRLEPVALQIGEGEHGGRIRLVRGAVNAIAKVRMAKGSIVLNFGHVPALGTEARPTYPVDARIVDVDTLEIVIPDWSVAPPHAVLKSGPSEDEINGAGDDEAVDAAMRSAPAAAVEANGLTVIFDDENERVVFNDREIEVTTRQAKLVAALAAEMPRGLDYPALIKRLWGSQPPMKPETVIDQAKRELTAPLREIGLDLRKTTGGLGLSVIGEPA